MGNLLNGVRAGLLALILLGNAWADQPAEMVATSWKFGGIGVGATAEESCMNRIAMSGTPISCVATGSMDGANIQMTGTYSGGSMTAWAVPQAWDYRCPNTSPPAPQFTLDMTVSPPMCRTPPCTVGQSKTVPGVPTGKWAVCSKEFAGCLTGTLESWEGRDFCDGACVFKLGALSGGRSAPGASVDTPKPVLADYTGVGTGATCSTATSLAPGAAPTIPTNSPPCAASDGVLTSSTGRVMCVPSGTPGHKPAIKTESSTETYPDGSTKTKTKTVTRDPASGAETESETETNTPGGAGGTQSGTPGTKTKNTDKEGSGGDDGKGNDKDDFCRDHPDSFICKNSTFSGACGEQGEEPSCEGDASLCAIAKAAYVTKCAVIGEGGTEKGKQLIDGNDPEQANLPSPDNPETIAVGNIEYTDGGGACPADLTFNILGRASVVSMSPVCTVGGWLGNIGVALSLLIAGFIVVGGIKGA